jgi:hypothetical protein
MKRLQILAIGTSLTEEDTLLVLRSLKYFADETFDDTQQPVGDELRCSVIFEDVVAKREVNNLRTNGDKFGYMLVLGSDAQRKLEATNVNVDLVECHTLVPKEWSNPRLRDRVIEQLRGFIRAWINCEAENKIVEVAQADTHKVIWIQQNSNQLKRHIQLMIQNNRPYAAFFQDKGEEAHLILRDATKKLRTPIQEVVPVVVEEKILGAPEKFLKKFEQVGYPKVFLMGIDEFMSHIMSMCAQMSGRPARIIVEPVNDTEEQGSSNLNGPAGKTAD